MLLKVIRFVKWSVIAPLLWALTLWLWAVYTESTSNINSSDVWILIVPTAGGFMLDLIRAVSPRKRDKTMTNLLGMGLSLLVLFSLLIFEFFERAPAETIENAPMLIMEIMIIGIVGLVIAIIKAFSMLKKAQK